MKKTLLLLFMMVSGICLSQKTVQNQRTWFAYMGQYKVSEKWGVQLEAQFRMDNQLEQNLQNVFRVGGVYYLSSSKNIVGGYALVNSYNASLNKFSKENRAWEQYQINKKWHNNKNTMMHRFRLEQRWVEQIVANPEEKNPTNYQNRFRYLNRNLFHLFNLNSENEQIYAVIQDEIFLNLGDNKINSKFIDQNRFLIGAGFNYNNNTRFELGFMNQFVTSSNGNNAMNHTVSVTLFQNLDFHKH